MPNIKKVFHKIVETITAIGVLALIAAWVFSFVSITFGLAIWSTQWFIGLL